MPIYALHDDVPEIDEAAFVHPDAVIIGKVRIGPESSVWPMAVLRGDHGSITIGARTSIQDGTVVHTTPRSPTVIGAECVVGHNVHIEGATVADHCLIASGSVLLNGSVVEEGAVLGAGAAMSFNGHIPARRMALGVPARIRENHEVPAMSFAMIVDRYVENIKIYKAGLRRLD